jgi:hypothetical protein
VAAVAAPLVIPAAEALWAAIVYVGSAIAVGAGIAVATKAVDTEFSEEAPGAVGSCPKAIPALPPPHCAEITRLMEERIGELKQRYAEMLEDKHKLYAIRPRRIPKIGSWPGHVQQYQGKQRNLIKLMIIAAADGCPVPPGAEEWATRPAPESPVTP